MSSPPSTASRHDLARVIWPGRVRRRERLRAWTGLHPRAAGRRTSTVAAPLVFAGYGIDAPEYAYDDFAGVDVAGKIVMVLSHEPQEADPQSRFMGAWNTVHAYQLVEARSGATAGAAAMLIVQEATTGPQRAEAERSDQRSDSHRPAQHSLTSPFWDLPVFTIDARVADDLLAGSGKTIDRPAVVGRQGRPPAIVRGAGRQGPDAPRRVGAPDGADAQRRRRHRRVRSDAEERIRARDRALRPRRAEAAVHLPRRRRQRERHRGRDRDRRSLQDSARRSAA